MEVGFVGGGGGGGRESSPLSPSLAVLLLRNVHVCTQSPHHETLCYDAASRTAPGRNSCLLVCLRKVDTNFSTAVPNRLRNAKNKQ